MARTLIPFATRVPRSLDLFRNDLDDLFENFFSSANADQPVSGFTPRTNLAETEDAYELSVEVPGMNPDDFNIELNGNELKITGELKNESEEKGKTFHRIERSYGKFHRAFKLASDLDAEKVAAEYKNGILHLTVAKAEAEKPKKIKVNG